MNPRVLIVEDQEALRAALAEFLRLTGYEVVEAASIAEADLAREAGGLTLLICDEDLPDGSGSSLLAEMLNDDEVLAAALVTARPPKSAAALAKDPRFALFAKPARPTALREWAEQRVATAPGEAFASNGRAQQDYILPGHRRATPNGDADETLVERLEWTLAAMREAGVGPEDRDRSVLQFLPLLRVAKVSRLRAEGRRIFVELDPDADTRVEDLETCGADVWAIEERTGGTRRLGAQLLLPVGRAVDFSSRPELVGDELITAIEEAHREGLKTRNLHPWQIHDLVQRGRHDLVDFEASRGSGELTSLLWS